MFFGKEKDFYGGFKAMEFREVLLTPDELIEYAKNIGKNHTVFSNKYSLQKLIKRLNDNFDFISFSYKSFNRAIQEARDLCPASEWLLDNFYKIEEQVKEVRQNLSKEKFLKLSTLNSGYLKGIPRIYGVALEYVVHRDGKLDQELLINFIDSYQSQRVLTIAEIWALSLMIRCALIENIRRICQKISYSHREWAKVESISNLSEEEILLAIKENIELDGRANLTYVEHLLKVLKRGEIEAGPFLNYLQNKLKDYNTTVRELIEEEHREQARRKISIGNSITSLNIVATLDWNDIFESLSVVEGILREDPNGVYSQLDFDSRDYYRKHIEKISKKLGESETRVARKAIEKAQEAMANNEGRKKSHVGYFLIDKGRKDLFESLGHFNIRDILYRKSPLIYLFPILAISFFILYLSIIYGRRFAGDGLGIPILIGVITLIPASDIGVLFSNWILTNLFPPSFLPRIEFREGISKSASTLVVVPTLLTSGDRSIEIFKQLEVFYLANPEENLYFALVGDFKDGEKKEEAEDREIINTGINMVEKLNKKYGREIFYYFHRERKFCHKQNKWLGWERKRGALVELNELLLGSSKTSYTTISGDINEATTIKYVLTIDADTKLPLDTAKKLIGIAAHPLNKPIIDAQKGIVVEGYGLVQPRIGVSMESSRRSLFTSCFTGEGGIDSYSIANSDVYQDLFGRGIFTGKGLYDVKVFDKLLKDTIPQHSILSHDLLEGSFLRAGLATDFELIDDYPGNYSSYMMRLHRWVRGDWQLIKWILPRRDNPLPSLAKWQIFDNLRRSLLPVALLLLFVLGAIVLPGSPWFWTGLGIVAMMSSFIIEFFEFLRIRYLRTKDDRRKTDLISGVRNSFYRACLTFIFLPYQAYMMADAIIRTLYRVFISRKNLLEWTTAADVEGNLSEDLKSYIIRMKSNPIIGLGILILTYLLKANRLPYILPMSLLWILGPFIAFDVSKEVEKKEEELKEDEIVLLRRIARKTWAYYEDFVGEDNNYLPPDSYQVNPPKGIVQRTSPTNIGFYLLSILTARDLGYLAIGEMINRMEQAISTIVKMDKWKGHLYNWYDNLTLQVLRPYYISTVDSGNFISYLITVREGLEEYLKKPLLGRGILEGLRDTLELLMEDNENEGEHIKNLLEGPITNKLWFDIVESFYNDRENDEINCGWERRFNDMLHGLKKDMVEFLPPEETSKVLDLNLETSSLIDLREIYRDHLTNKEDRQLRDKFNNINKFTNRIENLIKEIDNLVEATEFKYLYDSKRHLFSIGYSLDQEKLTDSYYDLLASEARNASYIAIARRQVPKKHWFKLGRAMTNINGSRALVSWTGTMFEYFMPYLVMKNFEGSLLDESYKSTLKAQKEYCRERNIPWGISESGYYTFDMDLYYQYKAFGIPDLGLKRGLSRDVVVSPYATFLTLPFEARGAVDNIKRMSKKGMEGEYGFYEAVDYMPRATSIGEDPALVKSFMAHHQGMILVALNNFFNKNIMQERFHRNPFMKAGEILLQERIPLGLIITKQYKEESPSLAWDKVKTEELVRTYDGIAEPLAKCQLLSNGKYSLMLTDMGTGYSKIGDTQITRWRGDAINSREGSLIFIHHLNKSKYWAAGNLTSLQEPDSYKVTFTQDRGIYFRKDGEIDSKMEVIVSPEDNVEIRRIILTNHGIELANIEVTSYLELVMTQQAADVAHPAFSNLFVRTEAIPEHNCLIASRRSRADGSEVNWVFHRLNVEGDTIGGLQYESNREAFIGRGRDITSALALEQPLGGSQGIVLDPILSLRKTLKIPAGQSASITFITGIEDKREDLISLVKKYSHDITIQRSFQLAITRSQVEANYLSLKASELEIFQDMIPQIIYLSPNRRNYQALLEKNKKSQVNLWGHGISGDLPIVLITIRKMENIYIINQFLKAHEYWRIRGLEVDLVILNEDDGSYLQSLHQEIQRLVFSSQGKYLVDRPGGIFVKKSSLMSREDKILLYSVARIVIRAEGDFIRKQIEIKAEEYGKEIGKSQASNTEYPSQEKTFDLLYDNGLGGFSQDGREYIIRLKDGANTPAPWINVVANEDFGFIVSERGSSHSWLGNSRENKLTPWSNDPVIDPSGEIIYIRDDERGHVWTPTPGPIRNKNTYIIKHGLGYSNFYHDSYGIQQDLTMYVAKEDNIKINLLKVKNTGNDRRKLTATYYIRPVLGIEEGTSQQHIITKMEEGGQGILIENPYNSDFQDKIAFVASSASIKDFTCDRQEFIGFNGSLRNPRGLKMDQLSNKIGGGLDPCVALQVEIDLEKGEEKEIVFLLGQDSNLKEVQRLLSTYSLINNCKMALKDIQNYWLKMVDTIQVDTPDPSMNIMLNQWLIYQSVSCRMWARTAFYQSGGAYGYRDQLQDAMNMVYPFPEATRQQILLHCAHQFTEGDVQHWWHPGAGDKGIRTRFSDDLLWLPYSVIKYISNTGDYSILEEEVHFLEEEALGDNEDERYGTPRISEEKASVYNHCIRSIERSLKFGQNGIPLMGSGDWNDGMNTVGNKGKGESVWLGWFMHIILTDFAEICGRMAEKDRGKRYIAYAEKIRRAIEKNAWDGGWYIRAFFDDGSPLGSFANKECKIDSLAQSWSIISGAGDRDRGIRAMEAVEQYLIKEDEGLILLFAPPFDKGDQKPGYIKGYVPGVRENGGQYTHAAAWVIKAFTILGDGDKAWKLFHLINPINHGRTSLECANYKIEPYVMAADVYAANPHVGRGGWSWYTGVAGWMYKVGIEDILGLRKEGDKLRLTPCIPKEWEGYKIRYRYKETYYNINVKNPKGENNQVTRVELDGKTLKGDYIPLVNDKKSHQINISM